MAGDSPDRYLINMSKAKRTGQDLSRLPAERPVLDGRPSLAACPSECAGIHARDVAAGEAWSGSGDIYDTQRAAASEEVESLDRLPRLRAISTGGYGAAQEAHGCAAAA
jgi:hypothetical protein